MGAGEGGPGQGYAGEAHQEGDHGSAEPVAGAEAAGGGGRDQAAEHHTGHPGGLDASLTLEGQQRDVPAAVDRTAYRIVQESLTNIARHAAAATAEVRIDYRPDALAIQVDDDDAW